MKPAFQTAQEFGDLLIQADQQGIDAVRNLADLAMDTWKDEPEKLAELAVEFLRCACRITGKNPDRLTQPYGVLFAEVNRYAVNHYESDLYERYGDRLIRYYWTVFNEDA